MIQKYGTSSSLIIIYLHYYYYYYEYGHHYHHHQHSVLLLYNTASNRSQFKIGPICMSVLVRSYHHHLRLLRQMAADTNMYIKYTKTAEMHDKIIDYRRSRHTIQ